VGQRINDACPDHDPTRAYVEPAPHITSHEDVVQRLGAYERRFAAWASGGLNKCEIGYAEPY
jgi:hypothetical protein